MTNLTIFDKTSFTLKELCKIMPQDDITECYIRFSSGQEYRYYLKNTMSINNKVYIFKNNNKKDIFFRDILQIFDQEFNKLIIRIKTESKNYDISVTWEQFEDKIKGLSKDEFKKLIL